MATVCTTRQFTTDDGILGLHRSAQARLVVENVQPSTGDGAITNPGVPGRTLIEQRAHWVNDFDVPVQLQVQIQRQRRTMYLSAPNFLFIRERYTWLVGRDTRGPILAPTPSVEPTWQTEWGGGIDVGVNPTTANYGQFRLSTPESTLMLPLIRMTAGQSIDVRFRASALSPYPWWPNPPGTPTPPNYKSEIYAFGNTIRMLAYPETV